MITEKTVRVTEAPFFAAADGKTNDREAIQNAIDFIYKEGGGTVILDAGKTFASTGIVLRSNVTLLFEDDAVLFQTDALEGYVKPVGDGYEPYTPVIGHNFSETIKWSHTWYHNYPFIFAPEGSHDFAIKGKGFIKMTDCEVSEKLIRVCPIGFYRVHDFEISDISITDYHGYAMMPFTCERGLIKNITIERWSFGNGDGICMMNCRDMRVTGCKMFTGDDSVYIFSSYKDPREGEWWSSAEPQASENIEIDHNDLTSNNCKAFGMILWGIDCPDLEKVEVRNVYIHDNHFKTMGNWIYNPYTTNTAPHPVTNVRFENNVIDGIESNFFETVVSDMNFYRSQRTLHNGEFADGKVFWNMTDGVRVLREEEKFAELSAVTDERAAIWQGIYLEKGKLYSFFSTVCTTGKAFRLFVRETDTGELIASKEFNCAEPERILLEFTVPGNGNYRLGTESITDGNAKVYSAEFAGVEDAPEGYTKVTKVGGKIIYHYN